MNYAKIYEDWERLPHCRVTIDRGDGGEGMHGKLLPDGTVGIDNCPLDKEFRWMDIVDKTKVRSKEQLIHRRWKAEVWYRYEPDPDEDKDAELRSTLLESLSTVGHPIFFMPGLAYVYLEDENDAEVRVRSVLSSFDVKVEILGVK